MAIRIENSGGAPVLAGTMAKAVHGLTCNESHTRCQSPVRHGSIAAGIDRARAVWGGVELISAFRPDILQRLRPWSKPAGGPRSCDRTWTGGACLLRRVRR